MTYFEEIVVAPELWIGRVVQSTECADQEQKNLLNAQVFQLKTRSNIKNQPSVAPGRRTELRGRKCATGPRCSTPAARALPDSGSPATWTAPSESPDPCTSRYSPRPRQLLAKQLPTAKVKNLTSKSDCNDIAKKKCSQHATKAEPTRSYNLHG
jgi:hypothetical protein